LTKSTIKSNSIVAIEAQLPWLWMAGVTGVLAGLRRDGLMVRPDVMNAPASVSPHHRVLKDIPECVFLHRGPEDDAVVAIVATGSQGYDVLASDGRTFRVSGNCLQPISGVSKRAQLSRPARGAQRDKLDGRRG
jgi:hypothetical protein